MQLHTIRGGNKEDLGEHKYNIGVGISLGNKWFTIENILGLIEWSLEYTREKVVVYVADSIHALNIEARSGKSPEKSRDIALRQGKELMDTIKGKVEILYDEERRSRVSYAHWDELANESYKKKVQYLYSLYDGDVDFMRTIHRLVEEHVANEGRTFSDESLNKMARYILEELPEVMMRVSIGGIVCDAYVYPFDGGLTQLVEQLQKGTIFPEVRENVMDAESKVFLEVR